VHTETHGRKSLGLEGAEERGQVGIRVRDLRLRVKG